MSMVKIERHRPHHVRGEWFSAGPVFMGQGLFPEAWHPETEVSR